MVLHSLYAPGPPGAGDLREYLDIITKPDKLELPTTERHTMSHSAITTVKNFGTADYRYQDRHIDDTQGTEAFLAVRNGWKASYHTYNDTWHVSTPSGLQRTYTRVR